MGHGELTQGMCQTDQHIMNVLVEAIRLGDYLHKI